MVETWAFRILAAALMLEGVGVTWWYAREPAWRRADVRWFIAWFLVRLALIGLFAWEGWRG